MTDTTNAAAPATTSALDSFFARLKSDIQVFEQDVMAVIQNIGAGIEVGAEDLQYSLSWLGTHIGQIAQTVSAVQSSVNGLAAAGVPIPASITSGIQQLNDAVTGVDTALSNEAVTNDASTALVGGYNAAKTLQAVAANVAVLAASVNAATAPTTPAIGS